MNKRFALFGLGSLLFVCQAVLARQPLTFEDRVKAQEAIERVYYNHRIWPKENPTPKPPFEQMVPRAMLEAKVTDYLKKSAALGEFWQRPIQPEQLQAEMDRMAKGTKDPATLKELYAELNNDPYVIAECLARPILADRAIRNWYANDERFHGETKAKAEAAFASVGSGGLSLCGDGSYHRVVYVLGADAEKSDVSVEAGQPAITLDPQQFRLKLKESPGDCDPAAMLETPSAFLLVRTALKTSARIEIETLIFQKRGMDEWLKNADLDGFILSENAASYQFTHPEVTSLACGQEGWDNGILDDVPDARSDHSAVWTGSEMIVWGGMFQAVSLCSGGRYNPATDSWTSTSTGSNVPSSRWAHTAVWTGTQMIVWGGYSYLSASINTGGRYDPASDSWLPTSMGTNVPSARYGHTAVWTCSKMIVWGGHDASGYCNSGGCYDPSGNSWTATSTGSNVPSPRYAHTAIWTGTVMIVWGGQSYTTQNVYLNTGGLYNPSTNLWSPTSVGFNLPVGRSSHSAIWTGAEMIVWGGGISSSGGLTNTGGRYNPTDDTWQPTSIGASVPAGRASHVAVWTGAEMVIWGGNGGSSVLNSGGRYDPSSDNWVATSAGSNVPSGRYAFSGVWTGSEMIVCGGENNSGLLNNGGRYNPASDSWLPTSLGEDVPSPRCNHAATWTGVEMVIWGGARGSSGSGCFNSGGKYTPATDSWSPVSAGANVPSARAWPSAVWTGTEMIIWGGREDYDNGVLNTGGRYNPTSDTWGPTAVGTGVPSARVGNTAVWTGTEMIIWGGGDSTGADFNSGGKYNPVTDSWVSTSTGTNCPSARTAHTAVWTGTVMIVWGGSFYDVNTGSSTYLNTGGRYDPSSDSWAPTSMGNNVPSSRVSHSAVWTGSKMVIWGGSSGNGNYNTGASYTLSTNSWQPTSTGANVPAARWGHRAVWTGSRMLIWGGGVSYIGTGGSYDSTANSWDSISTGNGAPLNRYVHSAIWTGSAMIVWGGENSDRPLSSGGRYMPNGPAPSEVPNASLFWNGTGKVALSWSVASCATGYRVYRGNPADLVDILTGASACRAYDGTSTTTGATLTSEPASGSFYWYLAVGYNASGEGSAGQSSYGPRMILSTGTCLP